jgi:serine/threonine protein kinase
MHSRTSNIQGFAKKAKATKKSLLIIPSTPLAQFLRSVGDGLDAKLAQQKTHPDGTAIDRSSEDSSSGRGDISIHECQRSSHTPPYRPSDRHAENYKRQVRRWYDHVTVEISRRTVYATKRILGEGSQGRAILMERRDSTSFVVAKIFANEHSARAELQAFRNDIGEHENLVRMVDAWEYDKPIPGSSVLVLEYCELGTLSDYKDRLRNRREAVAEGFIWHVALSLSQALAYLHCGYDTDDYDADVPFDRGYSTVHRDIKPENILLKTDPKAPFSILVKLGDFGLAYRHDLTDNGDNPAYAGGTYDWQPAESLQPPHTTGPRQDMWAVGAVIHYLALGEPRIDGTNADKTMEKRSLRWYRSIPRRAIRINGRPDLRRGLGNHRCYIADGHEPWSVKYSVKLNRWMMRLLQADPGRRATAVEVVEGMPDDFEIQF